MVLREYLSLQVAGSGYNDAIERGSRNRMELLLGLLLFANLFLGGLLLADYVYRTGGTMDERKAVVFEIYRYSICFIMVIVFGLLAFQLLSGLLGSMFSGTPVDPQALAGPGVGAIITAILFLAHWLMKNPALPKADTATQAPPSA
jgi:flagellar biosynthesis protein FliQ